MVIFAHEKIDWLKTHIDLPYSIPSHDSFTRFFSLISTGQFLKLFFQ
jgi:hypothetical protein